MKFFVAPSAPRVLAWAASAAAVVLLASVQTYAQGRQPVPPGGRPSAPATRPVHPNESATTPPSVREREFILRGMEAEAKRPPTEEQQRLAMQQIAEDYREIQQVNNRMMAAAMKKGAALDFGHVSNVTSEIKRRALRLRQN
ncbi:MAG TPA: hypothetical protein VGV38_16490, partial [Pyrinomonadaceae bacterium]|nr:hypothetical protein [Pyrinomonadaceae bacterium]